MLRTTKIPSPLLRESYIVTETTRLVENTYCPIDNTQLTFIKKNDYRCLSCGASYNPINKNSVQDQASTYIQKLSEESKQNPFSHSKRLEKIITAAKTQGLLSAIQ